MAKVAIISPHLDDAVLSCFLYMQRLIQTGHEVVVINLFTSCQSNEFVVPCINNYMTMVGCNTAQDYEAMRKTEDENALSSLNIKPINLDFIDAPFRVQNGTPEIKNLSDLFVKSVNQVRSPLLSLLTNTLNHYSHYDFAVIPTGIGCHVDHLLARKAAEIVWQPKQREYYLDMPYSLKPCKWRQRDLALVLKHKIWLNWTTTQKRQAMQCYKSQIMFVLPRLRWFPEVILKTNHLRIHPIFKLQMH